MIEDSVRTVARREMRGKPDNWPNAWVKEGGGRLGEWWPVVSRQLSIPGVSVTYGSGDSSPAEHARCVFQFETSARSGTGCFARLGLEWRTWKVVGSKCVSVF